MIANLEQRLRLELGDQLYDEYAHGLAERRSTGFCDQCIWNQKRKADDKFYIECTRSADERVRALQQKVSDPGKLALLSEVVDGVMWAYNEFGWTARWYQAQAMRCSAQWQCHRWGRRTGKTNFLAIKSLHLCATKPGVGMRDPYTVLVVTPYEDQLKKIFQYARDALAKSRSMSPSRDIHDPELLEFPNGSKMIGFTAGDKTGARSDKIRGQDANAIVIDEADRIRGDDIDAVMAILASHSDCLLYFSTTPTGLQTRFKSSCEDPERGFREFWFASFESPEYTDKTDQILKKTMPRISYEHEILATFGSSEGGVFPPGPLKQCIREYPLGQDPGLNENTLIGVDCNDPNNGTHAVVIGVDNHRQVARMLDKQILRGEDFSKSNSERMLIEMFLKWQPRFMAFDHGYAHGQIDDIIEYGLSHPQLGLNDRVKSYNMSSNYEWRDPHTGVLFKRPMKPLMVGISQNLVYDGRLHLPKVEDHESGVIGQMRNFYVKRISQNDRPIYSQGDEHTLTALMIALLCWQLEILGFEPLQKDGTLLKIVSPKVPKSLPLPIGTRTEDPTAQPLGTGLHLNPTQRIKRKMWSGNAPISSSSRIQRRHF